VFEAALYCNDCIALNCLRTAHELMQLCLHTPCTAYVHLQFEQELPGLWTGVVERDIRVPGGPVAYMARRAQLAAAAAASGSAVPPATRAECSPDGLIKLLALSSDAAATDSADEVDAAVLTKVQGHIAAYALNSVLPALLLVEGREQETEPLLCRGDEVQVQVRQLLSILVHIVMNS
jgi:hypothetical protein